MLFVLLLADATFAQTKPAAETGTASVPKDIGWPRQKTNNGAVLLYYQPQIDEWKDYKQLSARFAFSLTPKGGKQILGVASIDCSTTVDKEERMVYFKDVDVKDIRFALPDTAGQAQMKQLFMSLAPTGGEPVMLDRVMADVVKPGTPTEGVAVKNDPPPIFYSTNPAVLLMVEGEPVLAPIEKNDMQFIVNSNWDLFCDKKKQNYYLLEDKTWLTATSLQGPWTQTLQLPKDMNKLPAGQNFDDVKKMIPPPPPSGKVPKVFFSAVPAELILVKGAPIYTKITGTQLMYIANTENDVFLDNAAETYYVLLSGRWFSAGSLEGPWAYAGDHLPADFAKIPPYSEKGDVLASVPGTIEASDAVMLAKVPTTVLINKAQAEANVKISYDGTPNFKTIEGTTMDYATNTQDKVIKVGDLYYLCFQAVWFVSSNPSGPWKTADSVPQEIYTIPSSSPVYNVTYVTQTNATESTVESSSTGGYFGMFILGAAVGAAIVYGTGYYYPPYFYWGAGFGYPVYRPWPRTYGMGAVYNPYTGGYAAGRRVYGPYGAAGTSAWYNPATGRYGRSASVQGMYGGRTVARSYNPWTGGYGATSQGHNAYAQWGSSVATRGGQWAQTGHITTANGTAAAYRTSTGQRGVVTHGANGTVVHTNNGVYAGHDGNVYRKNGTGNWSQYNKGNWNQVNRETIQRQGLGNSAASRERGQMQTQRFQNARMNRGGGHFGGFHRR
ncbi:hypothetical protein DXN05_19635 [Deminuibacter soli]|uniref:Carbohydrate-binding family V/XII n=1 Tax=Deminuibacter soli TaxID=2291815 RepID=A0A3E1NEN4_9BACT|nr:hypothetical protein DXN05_19635 [Deminuibacter soli]